MLEYLLRDPSLPLPPAQRLRTNNMTGVITAASLFEKLLMFWLPGGACKLQSMGDLIQSESPRVRLFHGCYTQPSVTPAQH